MGEAGARGRAPRRGGRAGVLATAGFHVYVSRFGTYGRTYGFVGAIIVMLIWFYLSALTILFGGEIAVSLEQGVHRREESDG